LFHYPNSLTVDRAGSAVVVDSGNYIIITVCTEGAIVSTLAGSGEEESVDAAASFLDPHGVVLATYGGLLVSDCYTIRVVTSGGIVRTLAGRWEKGSPMSVFLQRASTIH